MCFWRSVRVRDTIIDPNLKSSDTHVNGAPLVGLDKKVILRGARAVLNASAGLTRLDT
jgi:hypothetical protein